MRDKLRVSNDPRLRIAQVTGRISSLCISSRRGKPLLIIRNLVFTTVAERLEADVRIALFRPQVLGVAGLGWAAAVFDLTRKRKSHGSRHLCPVSSPVLCVLPFH
ncbi:hypothetical protein BJX64DRAFT_267151 [Aspergillus heterothallicus]